MGRPCRSDPAEAKSEAEPHEGEGERGDGNDMQAEQRQPRAVQRRNDEKTCVDGEGDGRGRRAKPPMNKSVWTKALIVAGIVALASQAPAWRTARVPYQQSEVYRFGNAIVDDWEGRVNAWPLDEGLIDYVAAIEIEGSDSLDDPEAVFE